MMYEFGFFPFHMIGMVVTIFFWILIIWGIIYILRKYSHIGYENEALNILKKRYAKGEITKEQFESMKKDLE